MAKRKKVTKKWTKAEKKKIEQLREFTRPYFKRRDHLNWCFRAERRIIETYARVHALNRVCQWKDASDEKFLLWAAHRLYTASTDAFCEVGAKEFESEFAAYHRDLKWLESLYGRTKFETFVQAVRDLIK